MRRKASRPRTGTGRCQGGSDPCVRGHGYQFNHIVPTLSEDAGDPAAVHRRPAELRSLDAGQERAQEQAIVVSTMESAMPKAYWVSSYRSISNPDAVAAYAKL